MKFMILRGTNKTIKQNKDTRNSKIRKWRKYILNNSRWIKIT